jgi:transcription initiation factor TFIIIB Brf1 subunit/transcription initiation factor TFIIB
MKNKALPEHTHVRAMSRKSARLKAMNQTPRESKMTEPNSLTLMVSSYATSLHLSERTQTMARKIAAQAESAGLTIRKKPEAIVAAVIYIAGILEDEPHTLAEIAGVVDVSPNTVQKHKTRIVRALRIRKH